jgi:hypothetical protein
MIKGYLIMINGVLAKRCLTFKGAQKELKELEKTGYKQISIAYDLAKEEK